MKNDKILNIAIIEDDQFYATLLSSLLTSKIDINVSMFSCGEDFLKEELSLYDIVILDLNLESDGDIQLSGRNMLRILDKKSSDVKVIVLTSEDEIQSAIEVLKNGAVDYVVKNEGAIDRLVDSIKCIKDFNQINSSIGEKSEKEKKARRSFILKSFLLVVIVVISYLMLSR